MKRLVLVLLILSTGCVQRTAGSRLVETFATRTRACTDHFQIELRTVQRRVQTEAGARDGIERAMIQYGTCMDKVTEQMGL